MAGPAGTLVGRLLTKVVPDTSTFAAELKAKLEAMDLDVKVKVKLDDGSLARTKAQLEAAFNDVDVEVDVDLDAVSYAKTEAALARLGRDRLATIRTRETGGGGVTPGGRDGQSEFGSVRALDPTRLLVLLGLLTSPAIVAGIATLVANVGALASGLTAAAGGAGVLTLGYIGLIARFNEANSVSPRLVESIHELRHAYSDFLDVIADEGFETLASGLDILTGLLPRLTPIFLAFNEVVQGTLDDLAGFLAGGEGQRMLDFFKGIGAVSFDLLLRSLGNLLRFFGRLFEALGPFAIEVLTKLEETTRGWADAVDGVGDSPKFQAFLDYVREVGPQVSDLFVAISDALIAIGKALAPFSGPVLEGLTGLFRSIADADPAVLQAVIVGTAAALAGFLAISAVLAIIALANPVVAISAALIGLAAALATFITQNDEARQGFLDLVDRFLGLEAVQGAIDTVSDAFDRLVETVSGAYEALQPTLEEIGTALDEMFQRLGPTFGETLQAGAEAIAAALDAIGALFVFTAELIADIWDEVGTDLIAVLEGALIAGQGILQVALAVIEGIFSASAAIIAGDWDGLKVSIEESNTAIIAGFDTVIAGLEVFNTGFIAILDELGRQAKVEIEDMNTSIIASLDRMIARGVAGVERMNTRIIESLQSMGSGGRRAVEDMNTSIIGSIDRMVDRGVGAVERMNTRIISTLQSLGSGALRAIESMNTSIISAIDRGIARIVSLFTGLGPRIRSALSGINLSGIGRSIIDSLGSGIRSGFSNIYASLEELTAGIPNAKGPPSRDRILLREPADLIMDGFIRQIESRFADVKDTFGRVPIDITGGAMLAGVGAAAGSGISQTFLVDPAAEDGYVERVAGGAMRGATRAINQKYGRR